MAILCGIAGKFLFKRGAVKRSLIRAMCDALLHRGPDDEGIHTEPGVGLGQRRLSVIDLRHIATPPLANEDESIWLIFNGEIYNFTSLRSRLERMGHVFRTRTDTEVILHLYEEYGTACLDFLRGMFAFVIWDSRYGRLFAARDRLGVKPFYYAKTPEFITFGSSISAVLTDPAVGVTPDLAAIDRYLRFQYVPSPGTAFEGICKLPPAHYLICDGEGNLAVSRYWRPPVGDFEPDLINEQDAGREILNALREATRLRMVSDVPLGALLSGGVDSGSIVALMAMEASQPVRTFSVGFQGDPANELPYARAVAKRYGTDHHEFLVDARVVDALPLLVQYYGEPFADPSAIPTYFVTRMARQEVTVALSGDGGDESFSGYDRYGKLLKWSYFDGLPASLRENAFKSCAELLRKLPYGNWSSRLIRGCRMAAACLPERYRIYTSIFKDEEREQAYSTKFKAQLEQAHYNELAMQWNSGTPALDWMMKHDQHYYLPDCLMVKADVSSMANSLELRSPFLDHKVIELAARIPCSAKRRGMNGKMILKEAVQQLLPREVLNKPKTGFGAPLARWFRRELRGLLYETLLDDRALRRGLFNAAFVRRLVKEQISGQRDWSNRLWALVCLELWFREFVD